MDFTEDGILDGKIKLRQPRRGYRVAIDPILLAAAVPASPADSILDVGVGTGAVSLALATRVPDLSLTGIDSNGALVELARQNALLNGVQIQLLTADVLGRGGEGRSRDEAFSDLPLFDHVVSNPPFWEQGRARVSAAPTSAAAAIMPKAALGAWVEFCAERLAPSGLMTLILPVGRLDETLVALAAKAHSVR
ncbi:MAG: methyltransferase, partial [Proteobacteria bacterium]|nr:methyltransferase [Pseudomonadota bacterium]